MKIIVKEDLVSDEVALKTESTQTYINLPSYIIGLRYTDLK